MKKTGKSIGLCNGVNTILMLFSLLIMLIVIFSFFKIATSGIDILQYNSLFAIILLFGSIAIDIFNKKINKIKTDKQVYMLYMGCLVFALFNLGFIISDDETALFENFNNNSDMISNQTSLKLNNIIPQISSITIWIIAIISTAFTLLEMVRSFKKQKNKHL